MFVGGTGRSGTHIVAKLLAQNRRYTLIPIEVRFHVDADGFPGLLAGTVTKEQFLERMRGFWWRGFQTSRFRGLHRLVPRERFDRALAAFESGFDADPEAACRRLFFDLLWQVRGRTGARGPGIIEQSCDSIAQAETLVRLFPEARFVHVVRDGRDASASRVRQLRWLVYPRTRRQGLEWWERRIRAIDRGARAIPEGALYETHLGRLLAPGRRSQREVRRLARFIGVGIASRDRMEKFAARRINAESANAGRWRRGLSPRRQRKLDRAYREILAGLEADGVSCAPALRRALAQDPSATPA